MHLLFSCLILMFASGICQRDRPYINFKLIKITARSADSVNRILDKLRNIDNLSRDPVGNSVVVIASPGDVTAVSRVVTEESAQSEIIHKNLQEKVDDEFRQLDKRRLKRRVLSLKERAGSYMTLSQIYEFQRRIVLSCSNIARVERRTIGYSASHRPITLIKISRGKSENKKTVFIEAGMHAREWLSPVTANYIIYQLACTKGNTDMLDLFNWEIVPVVNTDGYWFSHTRGHRLWRKNRQRNAGSQCVGTDLNRNFDAGFGKKGASTDPCSVAYRGKYPYSASESRTLKNYVMRNRKHIISYLSIHTYGQYILLPWGYKSEIPHDYQTLTRLARTAEKAMRIPFKIGNTFDIIYPVSGMSADFTRDKAGIALSYTWELMPNTGNGISGFGVNESLVQTYTPLIWKGIRTFAQSVSRESRSYPRPEVRGYTDYALVQLRRNRVFALANVRQNRHYARVEVRDNNDYAQAQLGKSRAYAMLEVGRNRHYAKVKVRRNRA